MFDIGFSEILLLLVLGLVVLGPKRLPVAIRTVMKWVHTVRNMAQNVQNELAQELKLQELQESIKKAEKLNLEKLSPELKATIKELKESAQKIQIDLEQSQHQVNQTLNEKIEFEKTAEAIESVNVEMQTEKQHVETQEATQILPAEPFNASPTANIPQPPPDEEEMKAKPKALEINPDYFTADDLANVDLNPQSIEKRPTKIHDTSN